MSSQRVPRNNSALHLYRKIAFTLTPCLPTRSTDGSLSGAANAATAAMSVEEFKAYMTQALEEQNKKLASQHGEVVRSVNALRNETAHAAGSTSSAPVMQTVTQLRKDYDNRSFCFHLPASDGSRIAVRDIRTCAKGAVSQHLYRFVSNLIVRDLSQSVAPSDNRILMHVINYAAHQQKGASASPPKSPPPRCRSALPKRPAKHTPLALPRGIQRPDARSHRLTPWQL